MSRLKRKPTICICENKDADQLRYREADQRLCFRYNDRTIPLLSKSKVSSLWPSSVLVQPGLCRTCSETTLLVFSQGGSNNNPDRDSADSKLNSLFGFNSRNTSEMRVADVVSKRGYDRPTGQHISSASLGNIRPQASTSFAEQRQKPAPTRDQPQSASGMSHQCPPIALLPGQDPYTPRHIRQQLRVVSAGRRGKKQGLAIAPGVVEESEPRALCESPDPLLFNNGMPQRDMPESAPPTPPAAQLPVWTPTIPDLNWNLPEADRIKKKKKKKKKKTKAADNGNNDEGIPASRRCHEPLVTPLPCIPSGPKKKKKKTKPANNDNNDEYIPAVTAARRCHEPLVTPLPCIQSGPKKTKKKTKPADEDIPAVTASKRCHEPLVTPLPCIPSGPSKAFIPRDQGDTLHLIPRAKSPLKSTLEMHQLEGINSWDNNAGGGERGGDKNDKKADTSASTSRLSYMPTPCPELPGLTSLESRLPGDVDADETTFSLFLGRDTPSPAQETATSIDRDFNSRAKQTEQNKHTRPVEFRNSLEADFLNSTCEMDSTCEMFFCRDSPSPELQEITFKKQSLRKVSCETWHF